MYYRVYYLDLVITGEKRQILAPTYDTECITVCIILTWYTGEERQILAPTYDTECITVCNILTEDLQMFVSNKKYICDSFSPTWYTGEEKQILAPTYDTLCYYRVYPAILCINHGDQRFFFNFKS